MHYQLSNCCGKEFNHSCVWKTVWSMSVGVTPPKRQETSHSHQLLIDGCFQKQWILSISQFAIPMDRSCLEVRENPQEKRSRCQKLEISAIGTKMKGPRGYVQGGSSSSSHIMLLRLTQNDGYSDDFVSQNRWGTWYLLTSNTEFLFLLRTAHPLNQLQKFPKLAFAPCQVKNLAQSNLPKQESCEYRVSFEVYLGFGPLILIYSRAGHVSTFHS